MQEPTSADTYLTTDELAELIKYDGRTIRNRLKDSALVEGVHYIRPFGRRKILCIRAAIERDIGLCSMGDGNTRCDLVDTSHGTAAGRRPPQRDPYAGRPGNACHQRQ